MVQNIQNGSAVYPVEKSLKTTKTSSTASLSASNQVSKSDQVSFSKGNVSPGQAQSIVLDRAYEKLRSIVGEAKSALGIGENDVLDTSPEATANRIADFAINFFSKYAKNNNLANDEAGRKKFADFIGGAIGQGIEEAKGILTALSALDSNIQTGIDATTTQIQKRLDDFVKNGPSLQ